MSNELVDLKRILLKTPGAHFHYCVERYLKGVSKSDFKKDMFFGEFEPDSDIPVFLNRFFSKSNYSVFKSSLLNLSTDVIHIKLMSPRTSYKDLSELSWFVSKKYLQDLLRFFDADDLSGSKKARFVFLFKILEPIFLFPLSSVSLTPHTLQRAKATFIGYTCKPSAAILKYLDNATIDLQCLASNEFDDTWLIREIRKSL